MKTNGKLKKYISEHRSFLCFIVNFIFFLAALIIIWVSKPPDDYGKAVKLCVIIFIVDIILSWWIISFGKSDRNLIGRKKRAAADVSPHLTNIVTLDLIYKFPQPVLISDSNGYIIWYNAAAAERFVQDDGKSILWKSVASVSGNQVSPEKFYEAYANSNTGAKNPPKSENQDKSPVINTFLNGRFFGVSMYPYEIAQGVSSETAVLNIFAFSDITEAETLKNETEMKDIVAAYFMIDNLDEAAQKLQGKNRQASVEVSNLLNSFISECGGVIKEYDRDKYLCFFENRALKNFIKSKFGILDSVRDIKMEELNMPVTISGGVSNISGSLIEKELAARRALDLALQRGGDQVVVKGLSSTEFFGGKTKTVQKRTKVRSRVIANELADFMKKSSNVLIMGHIFADSDSIGSCVGMARFAMTIAKCEANIIVNIHESNLKSAFAKLRGIEEYRDIFIDETAALDKITAETLVVVVDVNNSRHFESEAVFKNVYKYAVIDHHRKNSNENVSVKEPDIEYIEPSASSASELVAEILEQSLAPGELLKEEAELLLAGIFLDTKNFSRNTGTRTFSAALYLRGEGGNPAEALALFNKTNAEEFAREAQFASNIYIYRNSIAISVFDESVTAADKTAGAKAAERMLGIEGVSASFVIFMIDDTVHISARSTPFSKINVQIIMEAFGGGGHFEMAGAQIKGSSLKDVSVILKKTIDDYFDVK